MEPTSAIPDLSVVIPAYNSGPWLETTLDALRTALEATSWSAEVVVVDDGSTDGSPQLLRGLAPRYPYDLRVVEQANQGVFVAVWTGLEQARSQHVLILNSRLLLDPTALRHLEEQDALASGQAWNGHVVTDPATPLVGVFWDVPTHVFWGDYLGDPRPTEITPENFDRVPKGTGCFLVPRDLMVEAYRACWPDQGTRYTSDDTKLLRHIASRRPIRLEPGFSATYRPRTTVRKFLAHAAGRGTMFVDSYAGTSHARNAALVGLVLAPPVAAVGLAGAALSGRWGVVAALLGVGAAGLAAPAVLAARHRASRRAIASYLTYVLPFGVVFWRGLLRGVVLHRTAFGRLRTAADAAVGEVA
ncbi:glycosyltransferase [Cellulomonas sp. JZ18]|uniref:glycosyltransferase family 2 protein n=1 Tax=Cellulomonas sp. JZ18 TaxID=2654191 RepID=UPI0012D4A00D|nr:glycosyltransferase family A protein [Cellulomonas sp. JZ18]QGQ18890.1 glycosyltransferase [Cellulomonas sp. JZ18]